MNVDLILTGIILFLDNYSFNYKCILYIYYLIFKIRSESKINNYIQVLRVESPDGTKRVQVSQTESSYDLFEKVIHILYPFQNFLN